MDSSGNFLHFSPVLITQAAEGDDIAFKKLYDMISGRMYSLCLRYASNTEDANDLFQEGFIKLHRHLRSYKGTGSFEGWARTIFVSVCIDALKRKKMYFDDLNEDMTADTSALEVSDKIEMEDLMGFIRELPDGYRTIINLHVIEDYSHKEIAKILGITESGSKSKLHKARSILKRKITG